MTETGSKRHVFLSPHYDDIPLSCGGTVARIASEGGQPEIALVFGDYPDPAEPLTDFAQRLHAEWGLDAGEVIDARRTEEARAASLIGASDQYLPFRDAIYRGSSYVSDSLLFARPVAAEDGLPQQIATSLGLLESDRTGTTVYAPLAIGGHVDHQLVFQTGRVLHDAGYTVRFYEDLPYALSADSRQLRFSELGGQVEQAETVPVGAFWDTKIDAIMCYQSQVAVIFQRYVGVEPTRAAISEAMHRYAVAAGNGIASEQFWSLTNS